LVLLALRREDSSKFGCAGFQNLMRVDCRGVLRETSDQAILEDGLADGDEEGAAQILEEDRGRGAESDVLRCQHSLHGGHGSLEPSSSTESRQDLVSDPQCWPSRSLIGRLRYISRYHSAADQEGKYPTTVTILPTNMDENATPPIRGRISMPDLVAEAPRPDLK
jgi:hypothetical protein